MCFDPSLLLSFIYHHLRPVYVPLLGTAFSWNERVQDAAPRGSSAGWLLHTRTPH